ncbi:hypothetical protein [Sediminitomix flava]|uniref:Phage integrase family protein n=1 Tax=Sediminitomix flava TaxID=379075 RepID=A0A315Z961_SEDFL|nr:hypothetical protein [Sediminitomix flava]PWJ41095.1 hypothetical protein BC781_104370 [Sediminitomix flava]
MILRDVPAETVMKYTGHRTLASFWQYINISEEKEHDLIRDALGG